METTMFLQAFVARIVYLGFVVIIPLFIFSVLKVIEPYFPIKTLEKVGPTRNLFEEKIAYVNAKNQYKHYLKKERDAFRKKIDPINFLVVLVLSMLFILVAIFMTEVSVYSGMLTGALIAIILGYTQFSYSISNFMNMLFLLCVLLILVFLTYKFLFVSECS